MYKDSKYGMFYNHMFLCNDHKNIYIFWGHEIEFVYFALNWNIIFGSLDYKIPLYDY